MAHRIATSLTTLALILAASPTMAAQPPAPASPNAATDTAKDEGPVTIVLTGDVSMTWRPISRLAKELEWEQNPLRPFKPWFDAADLTVANAEAVFMKEDPKYAAPEWNLWAPVAAAQVFAQVGIDVVGHANNHTFDGRAPGVHETLKHLEATGVTVIGSGRTKEEATRPYKMMRGGRCIVGIVPATIKLNKPPLGDAYVAYYRTAEDQKQLVAQIRRVDGECATVIAYIHWGAQFKTRPHSHMKKLGRAMVDAGADIVVGHHSHVLGSLEHYKGGVIAYSLGNLVFSSPWLSTRQTGVLRVTLDPDADRPLTQVEMLPVYIERRGYWPEVADAKNTRAVFELMKKHSRGFNTKVELKDGRLLFTADKPWPGDVASDDDAPKAAN